MPDQVIPGKFAHLELPNSLNQRSHRLLIKKYCVVDRRVVAAINGIIVSVTPPFP